MSTVKTLVVKYDAPRHPEMRTPTLEDVVSGPSVGVFGRSMHDFVSIWEGGIPSDRLPGLAPHYKFVAFRDGIVFIPARFEHFVRAYSRFWMENLPGLVPLLGHELETAGVDSTSYENVAEILGEWLEERNEGHVKREDAEWKNMLRSKNAFYIPFVDIVQAEEYQVSWSSWLERNYYGKPRHYRTVTLDQPSSKRQDYTFGALGAGSPLTFMRMRIGAEVDYFKRKIVQDALGRSFWTMLFEKRAAEVQGASPMQLREIVLEFGELERKAREAVGLTEQKLAARVLAEMTPTLPWLRRIPPAGAKKRGEIELLEATAGGKS